MGKQLPVQDENFQVSPENMEERSCEVKSSEAKSSEAKSSEAKKEVEKTSILPLDSEKNKDSEDELRSRIFGLTKELTDMKQFMAEKMQKQTEARKKLTSEIAELLQHSEKVQSENSTFRMLLGVNGKYSGDPF